MITCKNCGNQNDDDSRICTSCGVRLQPGGQTSPLGYDNPPRAAPYPPSNPYATPPSPYMPAPPSPMPSPYAYQPAPGQAAVGFKCPYCQSQTPPVTVQKVSQAGWIVMIVMILVCVPLFWIGLLMKEDQRFCRACGMRLG